MNLNRLSSDRDQKLAIVIPVHNRRDFTRACLEHLRYQTRPASEIVVVDDGSTDGTGEMVSREFPEVALLYGDGDLWWTGATNLGVKLALERGASHVMTLNDDTLPGPAFVETMMEAAARQHGALIGAVAVDAGTGRQVFAGARVNWLTASFRHLLSEPSCPQTGLVEVSHYPGRGLLIPREVFERIGFFDAVHFPHYIADFDFTCRARRSGFPIFCNRLAVLRIYPEASGDADNRRQKGVRNYFRHLFHIKGGANLKAFIWFALRNCPRALLPICLLVGLARRIFGYPLDWVFEVASTWWRRDASYRRA